MLLSMDQGPKRNRNENLPKSNSGLVKKTTVENYRLLIVLKGMTFLGGLYLCRVN